MELNEELQVQVVSLSSQILEVNVELQNLQERYRTAYKENVALKAESQTLKAENAALAQRTQAMEDELADLSSGLVDEANNQVGEANRRAAVTLRLLEERDNVIESQAVELTALKDMLEQKELDDGPIASRSESQSTLEKQSFGGGGQRQASSSAGSNSLRTHAPSIPGELSRELILDLDAYATPLRPLIRTDLRDFEDFLAVWGVDREVHTGRFAKLETSPWRKPRYIQRVISEDIEPTLRLGKTPHLSWLACRAFLSGILDQTLALDPVSVKNQVWAQRPSQPCLLCGESRTDDMYARSYWARPAPDGEPIVLDLTCVAKTRLVCEFVGFLREIARSLKPEDRNLQVKKWRQCNAMREQLFWARTGGLFPESSEIMAAVQTSATEDFDFNVAKSIETRLRDLKTEPADATTESISNKDIHTPESPVATATTLSEDLKEENRPSQDSRSPDSSDGDVFEGAHETLPATIASQESQVEINRKANPSVPQLATSKGAAPHGKKDMLTSEKDTAMPGGWPQ